MPRPAATSTHYDHRNIIDMSEYISFLAEDFRNASEAGRERVCIKRQFRMFATTVAADYIPLNQAIILKAL